MKPDFPHGTPHPPFLDLKLNLNSEVARWSPLQALTCAPISKPNHTQPSFRRKLGAPPFASFAQSRNAFLSGTSHKLRPDQRGSVPTWFMPALTKSKLGSPRGLTEADGTRRWPWRSRKKLRKASRTAAAWVGGASDESARRLGPRHCGVLRTARRRRPAAAATDTAILTRGNDFTGSKGSAG